MKGRMHRRWLIAISFGLACKKAAPAPKTAVKKPKKVSGGDDGDKKD